MRGPVAMAAVDIPARAAIVAITGRLAGDAGADTTRKTK